jgi:hypothetical protein
MVEDDKGLVKQEKMDVNLWVDPEKLVTIMAKDMGLNPIGELRCSFLDLCVLKRLTLAKVNGRMDMSKVRKLFSSRGEIFHLPT